MNSPQSPAQGSLFGTIALISLGITVGILVCLAVVFFKKQPVEPASSQARAIRAIASSVPPQPDQQVMVSPSLNEAWTTEQSYTIRKPIIEQADPEMGRTASGYPIAGSSKAIDWGAQFAPVDPACVLGRNGLQGNPPVDPPSSKGRAYSMGYQ